MTYNSKREVVTASLSIKHDLTVAANNDQPIDIPRLQAFHHDIKEWQRRVRAGELPYERFEAMDFFGGRIHLYGELQARVIDDIQSEVILFSGRVEYVVLKDIVIDVFYVDIRDHGIAIKGTWETQRGVDMSHYFYINQLEFIPREETIQ